MPHSGAPFDLRAAAERAMEQRGFEPALAPAATRQLLEIAAAPAFDGSADARDLLALLWSSIDNTETRDLDQLEVAESLADGRIRIRVAIADVDAVIRPGSPLDAHAAVNTTSVYTGVTTFPMLPAELSTDITSLGQDVDRLAVVIEFDVDGTGVVTREDVYRAWVRNRAKLAYDSVGAWLDGKAKAPPAVAASAALARQLQMQHEAASRLRTQRARHGALELETIEATPVVAEGEVVDLAVTRKGPGRDLIEDFMIAANSAAARKVGASGRASIRRVVTAPKRWPRIVELARSRGTVLPDAPDPQALATFLSAQRAADPVRFPDLSLAVVKLLGRGEYVVQRAGAPALGHFGLAVDDYTHSTAPNRRYADLVTLRVLKATLAAAAAPYTDDELEAIAARCTAKADDAQAVERLVRKQAAAVLLGGRIGQMFDAIVTGVTPKGTFARLTAPPAEGLVVNAGRQVDVGDAVRVRVVSASPAKGFIDFALA